MSHWLCRGLPTGPRCARASRSLRALHSRRDECATFWCTGLTIGSPFTAVHASPRICPETYPRSWLASCI